jgi:predicted amidohydrolase
MKLKVFLISLALFLITLCKPIHASEDMTSRLDKDITSRLNKDLIIQNVTVISPERGKPLESAHVKITNGIISEISTKPFTINNKTSVIDATGQFLSPGLMDSHVHLTLMPGLTFANLERAEHMQASFVKQQPRSYLYFGVTQLLDPSQSVESIQSFNRAEQKPDLFHCGAAPIVGGYPTVWVSQQETYDIFRYLIVDDKDADSIPEGKNPADFTPEAVVKRMAEDGAICVKVFIEDGFGLNNQWPLISDQLLKRVKNAAKQHGLIMMAHANAIDMQVIAEKLSVDVIAHGLWNWNQFDGQTGIPAQIKQLLDQIIEKGITFQPTFNVMDGLKEVTVPGVLNDPLYAKVIGKQAMNWYNSPEGLWFRDEILSDFQRMDLAKIHQHQDNIISQGERVVEYLNRHQHPIVLASDTPSSPTFAAQPGYSTYQELQHLHKAGLSLEQVLRAATINNAKAFRMDDRYGTVEPGKVANLLLLDGNPLKSISAYNQIDKIIVGGEVIDRETLSVR